jgi:hypothetical protein
VRADRRPHLRNEAVSQLRNSGSQLLDKICGALRGTKMMHREVT